MAFVILITNLNACEVKSVTVKETKTPFEVLLNVTATVQGTPAKKLFSFFEKGSLEAFFGEMGPTVMRLIIESAGGYIERGDRKHPTSFIIHFRALPPDAATSSESKVSKTTHRTTAAKQRAPRDIEAFTPPPDGPEEDDLDR